MATAPSVRIGTAERERAADLLGEHFRAGRLDMHEYDERITAAFAARTQEDLKPLFADLPATPKQRERDPRADSGHRHTPMPIFAFRALGLAILGAAAIALIVAGAPFVLIGLLVWLRLSGRMWGGYRRHAHHSRFADYSDRGHRGWA